MSKLSTHFLRKIGAIVTTVVTLVTISVPAASAFTITDGGTTGTTYLPTTPVAPPVGPYYPPQDVVPVISNPSAYPPSFKPSNGEKTTIHFALNTGVPTTVKIQQNGLDVYTFLNNSYLNAGSYDFIWNGLDKNGTLAKDGTYQYVLSATNTAGSANYQNNIIVASNPSLLPVVITASVANPNPFNPDQTQTSVTYSVNTATNLNIDVVDGISSFAQLSPSPYTVYSGSSYTVTWNGRK